MKQIDRPAELLRTCYAAALDAVAPAAALRARLETVAAGGLPCWLISVGKASGGMAAALVGWLAAQRREPEGGIVVAPQALVSPHHALRVVVGNHPLPGAGSVEAAGAIASVLRTIPPEAEVHVALSGGASALMAGPLPGLTAADIATTFALVLASGLDIHAMNAVRKRITRWSAGRMALALVGRRVHVWVISDVPGDDLSTIASGPCTGDSWTTDAVHQVLVDARLLDRMPIAVQHALAQETLKPSDSRLAVITPVIVANNRMALAGAAAAARRFGIDAETHIAPLTGEAATAGREIACVMRDAPGASRLLLWGGETTVTMQTGTGLGGRSQELALAAAQQLHETQVEGTLLAAGTDGRDGPSDAAGALVDRTTWQRIITAGRDPAADLASHDSYPALDLAGALIRTGLTGTNVMDLALALTATR